MRPVSKHRVETLSSLYKPSLGSLTDLYQLTMAAGYVATGMDEREAVFHLYFRRCPFQGGYAIAAGMADAAALIAKAKFSRDDVDRLRRLEGRDGRPLFDEGFLAKLTRIRWRVDIDAVPEGSVVLPRTPILRIRGPLWQAQLLETALLTIVNFQTLIATKASRVVRAARGKPVFEFGLRRAQGLDGAMSATRAAYVGGVEGTSNVMAATWLGIPARGTHAHSWVTAFDDELTAFREYASVMPGNTTLLVDTYDTASGVDKACVVAREMEARGQRMFGIRLDSGDLLELSRTARRKLDSAGVGYVKIVASNDLDEHEIDRLERAGAAIDVYGVGTKLVVAYDQPALGGVYKLAAIRPERPTSRDDWKHVFKRSNDPIKASLPGVLDTRRFVDRTTDELVGDMIVTEGDDASPPVAWQERRELRSWTTLRPVVAKGKPILDAIESLESVRQRATESLSQLPERHRSLAPCEPPAVFVSPTIETLRRRLEAAH